MSTPRRSRFRAPSLVRTLTLGALALAAALVATNLPIRGLSSDLVISQVYGGGGNTGAQYRSDFVEIFNRGSVAVSLAGKSIQYASATGTGNFGANGVTLLLGTLQPGQYYLVQLANGTNGAALPTPDVAGTTNMSGTGGKVALVNSTGGLACNGSSTPCSAAQLALIVDLVGWDGANFYEGAAAPATTNTTAVFRAGGGCTETDNNSADFTAAAPGPRNTASAFNVCAGSTPPSGIGSANPAAPFPGDPTLLTVAVTPGANPTSTGITVSANLTAIGGSAAQAFFDDGTNGDVVAGDRTFSWSATVSANTPVGPKTLPVTVGDSQGRTAATSIALTVSAPPTPICAIQGAGATSPQVGQSVTTRGVVTARRFNNGFFIQMPDRTGCDPQASSGVFVFTSSAPPAVAAVGAYVQVIGTVQEYVPSTDPYSPPLTEIVTPTVTLAPGSFVLPGAVTLVAGDLVPTGGLEQLERYEGMRVFVPALRVASPTEGSVAETSASGSSNGLFFGVIDGTPRPFREPGVQVLDALPAGSPPDVPRFDLNPERLRINSWGQIDSVRIDVTSGALVSNLVGVLDYAYRTWTILPDLSPTPPITVSGLVTAVPVPVPDVNEFTVASFNMERFFDNQNDPTITEPVLSAAAFERRLNKASLAVRNVMRLPDILGVQEIENLTTLQTLAARLNSDAVAAGSPNPGYVAYLEEGNDPGGIDVGFLVRTSRVSVSSVVQEGKDTTYVDPNTGLPVLLNDRPPLVLTATVQGPTGTLPITAIVNHLRSLNGVEDPVDGRVRAKRLAQAEFLADLIQAKQAANPYERIISVGDYNAYEFSDGYVDVVGSVKGTPAPAAEVVLTGPDLVNPDLVDLTALASAAQRYSYSFDGSAQLLDHIIANGQAADRFSRVAFARSNADFPESYRSDGGRPERLSDHDAPVAYFVFPGAPVLTLNGDNPMTVEVGSTFVDPGATAYDADFGDLTAFITVSGTVDAGVVGTYTLTYSVSNWYATTTNTRTVHVVDTTPPVVSNVVPSVRSLWPANHQFVPVGLSYTATDNSGSAGCSVQVVSNEPVNGTGDGDTSPDWLLNSATWVQLRAERAGTGMGRVYTITVTCSDASGNATSRNAAVAVPKSMGNGKK